MMKRFVSMMLVVLTLMLAVFVPAAALAGEEGPNAHAGYYYVKTGNGKGLNVRDNPNGKVVGSLLTVFICRILFQEGTKPDPLCRFPIMPVRRSKRR